MVRQLKHLSPGGFLIISVSKTLAEVQSQTMLQELWGNRNYFFNGKKYSEAFYTFSDTSNTFSDVSKSLDRSTF